MTVKLMRAGIEDAERIWHMQRIAFSEMLDKYQDFDTSPAAETIEKTQARLLQSNSFYYIINAQGADVGAVRVIDKTNQGKKSIFPLFILPQYRRRGYAKSAILEIEKIHGSDNWILDTVLQEEGNVRLYEMCGYKITDIEKIVNAQLTLVFMEK